MTSRLLGIALLTVFLAACNVQLTPQNPQPIQLEPQNHGLSQVGPSPASGTSFSIAVMSDGNPIIATAISSDLIVKRWDGSNQWC
jgi:hypothetical protein